LKIETQRENGRRRERNRKEFVITKTLEILIAAAANIGLSNQPNSGKKTPAATGIKAMLYPYAHKKL